MFVWDTGQSTFDSTLAWGRYANLADPTQILEESRLLETEALLPLTSAAWEMQESERTISEL
jgi:hypothetical protein